METHEQRARRYGREREAAAAVIEIRHECPILDVVWKSPITDESIKGVKFFCWANNVYWYSDEKYNFFESHGRREAATNGFKHIVMDNLS
jgi:hypothetical protein